jgi:Ca2+/H+ antiporter, TMEM165/GDT1 family
LNSSRSGLSASTMDAFLTSTLVVALAEIGDKTQLLAIVLGAAYRRPWPVIAGITLATLVNHFLAALLGASVAGLLDSAWLRYSVGLSFIVIAGWVLIPDKVQGDDWHDDDPAVERSVSSIVIGVTIMFFLAEMADKTQIATIALGAQFQGALLVTMGTTLGMLIANVPAVFLGERVHRLMPAGAARIGAALLFFVVGCWVLVTTAGLM